MNRLLKGILILLIILTPLFLLFTYKLSYKKSTLEPLPLYVISLREDRWQSFLNRWHTTLAWEEKILSPHFWRIFDAPLTILTEKWAATDGRQIAMGDPRLRIEPYKYGREPPHLMRRGEVGCFDSHVRIWKDIVQKNIPLALVFEDDANFSLERDGHKLKEWVEQFKNKGMTNNYDLLFVGYIVFFPTGKPISSNLHEVDFSRYTQQHVTHGMLVTQSAAKKLLEKLTLPYPLPVDFYIAELVRAKVLRALQVMPYSSAISVVSTEDSDTRAIQ